jgi:hypothetical protein
MFTQLKLGCTGCNVNLWDIFKLKSKRRINRNYWKWAHHVKYVDHYYQPRQIMNEKRFAWTPETTEKPSTKEEQGGIGATAQSVYRLC